MAGTVTVLGIRHHGPGSAREVVRALETLKPGCVLIEGPPDAADIITLAGHKDMKPPVALLVYEPDQPSESVYYPFAEFSPEWQAIRWALDHTSAVRFIDLPRCLRASSAAHSTLQRIENEPEGAHAPQDEAPHEPDERHDPLEALAIAAGFSDGESWWGRLIEERRGDESPIALFDSIRDAIAATRKDLGSGRLDQLESAREAHMRKSIRTAMKEGHQSIAVVCGAWHAPALSSDALDEFPAKADDAILKGLTKRKTTATWIPWTYDRLSMFSGYGAGIASPGWYEHLWINHDRLTEKWMTRVARMMRDEDLDASPASIIESVRLAETLAALRGRSMAGLEELGDATLSILCHGNPMPMRVISAKLIVGNRLGEVPEDAPTVPLQRDLAAQQKSLRMKVSADDTILNLDQRKENDLARSRLLHRLKILKIEWGTLDANQQQHTSTFHEVWRLQWKPEFAVAVMEAARWGNTVPEAAAGFVAELAANETSLVELTDMLDDVMLADLPSSVERLINRIQDVSAVASGVGHLMEALPPLARGMRYGNVRMTDSARVEPIVAGLLARVCAGLLPACGALDDDAAAATRTRIDSVHSALSTLDRDDFMDSWKHELQRLSDADIHGLIAGRAWRHLVDTDGAHADAAANRLALALSRGNDPGKASAWLEGFLGGSGMILVHDARLLSIVDKWVTSLSRETFEQICPIVRRTFSTFEKPERRQIGEKLARGDGPVPRSQAAPDGDYDAQRGALVEPILRLILGDMP